MEQTPNSPQHDDELEPFIPPHYMLYLAGIGLIITVITLFTQTELTVIGWGGLGLAALSFAAWVMMAPQAARAFFTGRSTRIGLMTLVVTIVFLAALVAIYAFVAAQDWRVDFSQSDEFSLNDAAREAISTLAVDPTKLPIRIFAFYGVNQAGQRDRDTLLFDDYVSASGGKISYEFIDPDLNPLEVEKYGNPNAGQLVVAALDDNGEPNLENAETTSLSSQETLTNAILRASASGDFRAYFLTVENGLSVDDTSGNGLSKIKENLELNKWRVEQIQFFDLTGAEGTSILDDAVANGIVLVIAGGTSPLPDEQLKVITDYMSRGGDVVLLAAITGDGSTLATADNLSNYLYDNFGFKINNDIVLDPTSSLQTPLLPVAGNYGQNWITSQLSQGSVLLLRTTHSISINPETPANVTVTPLVSSSSGAFARTDIASLQSDEPIQQLETDTPGPFVLAVTAENTETGARVVAFGSEYVGTNSDETLASIGIENLPAMLYSTVWAGNFDTFVTDIPRVDMQLSPQDTPLSVLADLPTINLITILLLPFGVLAIGLIVWFNGREKDSTH